MAKKFIILKAICIGLISCATEPKPVQKSEPLIEPSREIINPATINEANLKWWKKSYSSLDKEQQLAIGEPLNKQGEELSEIELEKIASGYMMKGERRKARAYYHEIVRKNPDNVNALLTLATIYLDENRVNEAFSTLMEIKNHLSAEIRNDKSFIFKYRFTLALANLKRNDFNQGHKYLSKLISQDPTFAPAYSALAGSYLKQGQAETAEFIAKRGIEKAGSSAELFNVMGLIYRERNLLEKAESWFNKAIETDENNVQSLINRASIAILRHEYDLATKDIGRALSLNPYNVDTLIIASIILHKQKEDVAARDILIKALDLDPENANARFNLALLEEKFDHMTAARQLLQEVLQLEEEGSPLHRKANLKLVDLEPYLD